MSGELLRRALAAFVAALLCAAGPASAQERASREERKKDEANKRKPRLSLDIEGEEAYESNVPYTQVLGEDDFVTRGTARLSAALPITRGLFELGAEGGVNVYRTVKGLDRYTWGVDASVEQRVSRRAELTLEARSSRDFARDNPNLDVSGTLYPLTLMRSDTAEGGWRQRIGRRLDLRLDARGELYRFESPQQQDGWSAGVRLGLENAFGERLAVGAEGAYGRTAADPQVAVPPLVGARFGQTIEVASALANVRIGLLKEVELRLEGGLARFAAVGEPVAPELVTPAPADGSAPLVPVELVAQEPQTTPQLGATLEATFGRHVLTGLASRRIEQSYGVGTIGVNRVFSLGYRGQLARWLTVNLIGTDNRNAAPDSTPLSSGRSASASVDFTMPMQFGARLTYSYWDRQDPQRDWRSHTVSAALSKKFDWR